MVKNRLAILVAAYKRETDRINWAQAAPPGFLIQNQTRWDRFEFLMQQAHERRAELKREIEELAFTGVMSGELLK